MSYNKKGYLLRDIVSACFYALYASTKIDVQFSERRLWKS